MHAKLRKQSLGLDHHIEQVRDRRAADIAHTRLQKGLGNARIPSPRKVASAELVLSLQDQAIIPAFVEIDSYSSLPSVTLSPVEDGRKCLIGPAMQADPTISP
jgi:hypothetical protein